MSDVPTSPEPTQVRHPAQAALRTAIQALVGLLVVLPLVVAETGLDASQVAWLAPVLAVSAAVARIMALPQVDDLLERFGLGATPRTVPADDPPEWDDEDDTDTEENTP